MIAYQYVTLHASPMTCAIPQDNVTPLHYAAREGRTEVCVLLLSKGADINAVNQVRDFKFSMWEGGDCCWVVVSFMGVPSLVSEGKTILNLLIECELVFCVFCV